MVTILMVSTEMATAVILKDILKKKNGVIIFVLDVTKILCDSNYIADVVM